MYDVNIISTGSQGNCIVVDHSIMCDCGLSKKKVEESGYDLNQLRVLLISHKHADHTRLPFIRWAITAGVQVRVPQSVIDMLDEEGRIETHEYLGVNLFVHHPTDVYQFDVPCAYDEDDNPVTTEHIRISVHPQKHYDIVNYAFVMEKSTKDQTERLLYSTDLDTVEPTDVGPGLVNLGMFDTLILEGNYDETWLREYIDIAIGAVDPDIDASEMTDDDLNHWVRENYRQLPRSMSAGMFRAVQNMRHLSKQQARMYAANHLKRGGRFYEVHRSSMFYEKPSDWTIPQA